MLPSLDLSNIRNTLVLHGNATFHHTSITLNASQLHPRAIPTNYWTQTGTNWWTVRSNQPHFSLCIQDVWRHWPMLLSMYCPQNCTVLSMWFMWLQLMAWLRKYQCCREHRRRVLWRFGNHFQETAPLLSKLFTTSERRWVTVKYVFEIWGYYSGEY